jgi:hypothetical protein
LVCGRQAFTFGAMEVPELLQWIGGKLNGPQLADVVRSRLQLTPEQCAFAPKSYVSICGAADTVR